MLNRNVIFLLLFLCFSAEITAQCPFTVTVSSTESRCRESGTITVTPSGPGLFTYEVTSGPVLMDPQNGRVFSNMPAGNYVVSTTRGGCTLNTFVTVAGNYQEPGLLTATTTKVACPGGTGCITAIQPTLGRAPWSYSITAGPVTRPLQSSGVFCGLPGGTYTVQAFDSCSIVRTSQFSVAVDTGDFYAYLYSYEIQFTNCTDLIMRPARAFTNTTSHSLMKIWYQTPLGDTLKVNGFEPTNGPADTLVGQSHNYGDWKILAYDTCGRLRTSTVTLYRPGFYGSVASYNCKDYTYGISNLWKYGETVTYRVRRCSDNSIVGSETQVPPATAWYSTPFTMQYDTCYNMETFNTCGDTLRYTNFVVARPPAFKMIGCSGPACSANGKGNLTIWAKYLTGSAPYTFTIISGPEGVGNSAVQGPYVSYVNFQNLALGTYRVAGVDFCGARDTLTVVANTPLQRTIQVTQRANCSGGANIHIKTTSNYYNCADLQWSTSFPGPALDGTTPSTSPTNVVTANTTLTSPGFWEGDFIDVRSGTFRFSTYIYGGCQWDTTFNVSLYSAPVIQNARGYICPVTSKGTMSFTQTGGVAPFQYRIKESGGGSWGAWQSTTTFDGLTPSLYDVEVRDSCPNGSITSVTFASWAKADLFTTAPCAHFGNPLTVYADPVIKGVTYQWIFNGSLVANGASYTVPDFQYANIGNYQLRQTFPGGLCTDISAVYLSNCVILPVNISRLLGERQNGISTLNWRTFDAQTGVQFIVEKSIDGEHFSVVGTVRCNPAGAGNNYSFTDKNSPATAFYRVKIVMADGNANYSNIIKLFALSDVPEIAVTPVPFSNKLSVQINSKTAESYSIRLFDLSGKTVCSKNVIASAGNNNFILEESLSSLNAGIYIFDASSPYYSYKQKIIKQ